MARLPSITTEFENCGSYWNSSPNPMFCTNRQLGLIIYQNISAFANILFSIWMICFGFQIKLHTCCFNRNIQHLSLTSSHNITTVKFRWLRWRYITGVVRTRRAPSIPRINIQIVYMHKRLRVKGVWKGFLKKEDSQLTENNVLCLDKQK